MFEERFWEKVEKTDGCWLWKGGKARKGYGTFWAGSSRGGLVPAHRASWEIHNGPIPDGLSVLHRCDNPPCVRPDHLFLGTARDNSLDMLKKGRGNKSKGEKVHTAKLSENQVKEIRERYVPWVCGFGKLGKEYGVSCTTIEDIVRKTTWNYI